jgi:anti-sigma regulatory factor (Ser/Thr protein kinase)
MKGVEGPEIVALTLPCEERFIVVARMVVGGLAARLDLSYEHLDDLQLAAEAVLAESGCAAGEEITIELTVGERHIGMAIGPVNHEAMRLALDGGRPEDDRVELLGLGTLLQAVVDDVGFQERLDGAWIVLGKRVAALPRS